MLSNLEVALLGDVDDGGLGRVLGETDAVLLGDEGPDLVDVDGLAPVTVAELVEVSHTNFTEVTRMVLVKIDTLMMLTTSKTATTRVLTVLA